MKKQINVGDIVRVISLPSSIKENIIGKIGTVDNIYHNDVLPLQVSFSNEDGDFWFLNTNNVAKVKYHPLTINQKEL